jgi:hypothetical protein
MKYLKLFESYTESDIAKICKKYGIKKWSINSEGLVDVNGDVKLHSEELTKLPLNFGYVSGNFYCYSNQLINLDGAPVSVGGLFACSYNHLTSLKGCPHVVGGNFYCNNNRLTSLRFAPEEIDGVVDDVLPNPISDIPKKYLNGDYLEFIVKEQPDWRLYRKDGTIQPERLEQMIEWGIETKKIKPF